MQPRQLDGTYRLILFISKLFGVFPFDLKDGSEVRVSKPFLVHTCLVTTVSWLAFLNSTTSYKSRLYTLIVLAELVTLNISIVSSVIWLLLRYERLTEVFSTALAVQRRYGVSLKCKRYVLQLCLGSMVLLLVFIYRMAISSNIDWNKFLNKISYYLPSMIIFIIVMQFCAVNLLVGDCFAIASAALLGTSGSQAELATVLESHFSLLAAAETVNVCYGFQNLCIVTSAFIIFTSSIYIIISASDNFFTVVFSVIFYPSLCWNIIYICHETKNKAKIFTDILYQLALNGKSQLLSNNMKVCFHFAYTKEILFTATGFFVLDFPLICSMVAAATSYLLILIQFTSIEQTDKH